jgi:hypothetical protein
MLLITCNKFLEHVLAMLISLTYSSLNGANFKMSIAPMMPDSGVLYIGIRKSIELKTMTRVKIIETFVISKNY